MEKSRFDQLMRQYPNWVAEGNPQEVFTFFDGTYTHKGGVRTTNEEGNYHLEENENGIKIEMEVSGLRNFINEDMRAEFPVIQLFPIDGNEGEVRFLVPKR